MEEPNQSTGKHIGGAWRQSILAAYEATRVAFPGGEILAHLDHKYVYKEEILNET